MGPMFRRPRAIALLLVVFALLLALVACRPSEDETHHGHAHGSVAAPSSGFDGGGCGAADLISASGSERRDAGRTGVALAAAAGEVSYWAPPGPELDVIRWGAVTEPPCDSPVVDVLRM